MASSQASQKNEVAKTKPQCFLVLWTERIIWIATCFALRDTVAGWRQSDWATRLSPLLSSRALDVYSRLSDKQAMDYDAKTVFSGTQ